MTVTSSSAFASVFERYIILKRSLGRDYVLEGQVLHSLERFLAEKTAGRDLTAETFRAWCGTQEHITSGVRRSRMRIVRNFCLYRRRREPKCYVPDLLLFPRPHQPVHPYIFTDAEIQQLIELSSRLSRSPQSPLRPELFRLVVVLLFTTGIRRGELLRLTVGDYDPRQGTLLIRCTKFHKSRLLPLDKDVCREVEHYLNSRRMHRLSIAAETPLVGSCYGGGSPYTPQSLRWGLERLLRWAKIRTPKGRLPRTHDARHSFAVNALLRWYRSGVDVQSKLPFLAAYMGHVSIVSTYHYLHFVEPLASQASARFAQCYGSLVNHLGKSKGGVR
jgi:integrase/recombinase XerD